MANASGEWVSIGGAEELWGDDDIAPTASQLEALGKGDFNDNGELRDNTKPDYGARSSKSVTELGKDIRQFRNWQ